MRRRSLFSTELDEGGLIRSLGEHASKIKGRDRVLTDQRILGADDFVEQLLKQKIQQQSISLTERTHAMEDILKRLCTKAGITVRELQGGSRAMPLFLKSPMPLKKSWEYPMPK